jgi:septum formation protein
VRSGLAQSLDRLVLASISPRRLDLLRSLGLEVTVCPSGYDEPSLPDVPPPEVAALHARAKAVAVARERPRDVIVAADTVVDLDGQSLGKPSDAAEASRMLRLLSGREHRVHTAFTLIVPGHAPVEETTTTRVRFYPLRDDEIAEYVATGEPMDKAGAYGIQGAAAALVEGIDGDFYTVMGFPLARFVRALRRLGFRLPVAKKTAEE